MKFKIGDKVKIKNNIREYVEKKYTLGLEDCDFIPAMEKYESKVAEIESISRYGSYKLDIDSGIYWWSDYMFEPYKVEMKKEDLKIGDLCTFRNNQKAIYIGEYFYILGGGVIDKTYYDNKLNHRNDDDFDIIKVEVPTEYKTVYQSNEILDKTEKRYLATVIRPFRNEIDYIQKKSYDGMEYIYITFSNGIDDITFPTFEKNIMYKGMKVEKPYTLKELGI